jgi:hypothetical protein
VRIPYIENSGREKEIALAIALDEADNHTFNDDKNLDKGYYH